MTREFHDDSRDIQLEPCNGANDWLRHIQEAPLVFPSQHKCVTFVEYLKRFVIEWRAPESLEKWWRSAVPSPWSSRRFVLEFLLGRRRSLVRWEKWTYLLGTYSECGESMRSCCRLMTYLWKGQRISEGCALVQEYCQFRTWQAKRVPPFLSPTNSRDRGLVWPISKADWKRYLLQFIIDNICLG